MCSTAAAGTADVAPDAEPATARSSPLGSAGYSDSSRHSQDKAAAADPPERTSADDDAEHPAAESTPSSAPANEHTGPRRRNRVVNLVRAVNERGIPGSGSGSVRVNDATAAGTQDAGRVDNAGDNEEP